MNLPDFQPFVHEFALDDADLLESCFLRMSALPSPLFLDGEAAKSSPLNRYSFLAADPIRQFVVKRDDDFVFDQIRKIWNRFSSQQTDGLPPFQGGLAGYLGYELNAKLERISVARHDEFETPIVTLNLYDVVVAFDHCQKKGWIISQGWPAVDSDNRKTRAEQRLNQFQSLLFDRVAPSDDTSVESNSIVLTAPMHRVDHDMELFSDLTREDFLQMISKAVDYIRRGDNFQTNLSQRLLTPATMTSRALYLAMRTLNPAPFSGYFDFGDGQIISASPERLVRLQDAAIETRPIKGTRKRTGFPEVDLNVSQELVLCEKDRAENVMIVDLMRNDLSKVADPESVLVEKLCGIEEFEKVLHLVSVVSAKLRCDCDCVDLLEAVFPGGSITGAPKIRAMEIIAELEPTARGPYCGSLGYINHDGAMDFSIMIRTITAKGGWWQIPVGGGIVSDSDPVLEYEETWTKALGMLNVVARNQTFAPQGSSLSSLSQ